MSCWIVVKRPPDAAEGLVSESSYEHPFMNFVL